MDGPATPNRSSRCGHHVTSTATASRIWTPLSGHSLQRHESSSDSEASQLIASVLPGAPSHEPTRVVACDASQLTVPLLPPGPSKRTEFVLRVLWFVSNETLRQLPQIPPEPGWRQRIEAQVSWFLTTRQLRDILGTPTYTRTEGTGIEIRYALKHAAPPPRPKHQVAWHGTSMYNLGAILHDGHLRDSTPETGTTLYRKDETPIIGVYLFKDTLRHKTFFYAPWVSPCGDGLYWRCILEVAAVNTARVSTGRKQTDQWIFSSSGVVILAIHIEIRPRAELPLGDKVYTTWVPFGETMWGSDPPQSAAPAACGASQPAKKENLLAS